MIFPILTGVVHPPPLRSVTANKSLQATGYAGTRIRTLAVSRGKMNLSEIREHYFFQLTQKHEVHSALQIPTTLITLFLGILIIYSRYLQLRAGLLEIMFVLSSISVALSCYFIIRVLTMYKYEEIADIKEFLEHKARLEKYFEMNPTADGNSQDDYENGLALRYAEAIDTNAQMNRSRFSDIFWANRAIIVTGILIALTLYPYIRERNIEQDSQSNQRNIELQRSDTDC